MLFRNIKPLYAQEFSLRLPELHIRRLKLNRHLPQSGWVSEHAHACSQLLLYLSGNGSQVVSGHAHSVKPGMVFFIPPHVHHSFLEQSGRKPLCLALDLTLKGPARRKPAACHLNAQELMAVRQALSDLSRWRDRVDRIEPREAAAVLRLVDIFFRALELLPRQMPSTAPAAVVAIARKTLKEAESFDLPLTELASRIGYQPDYLNRLLKQACGLTLGQLRADLRLQKTKRLLAEQTAITDVSEAVGFADANYFSRWFRHLTGCTPTAWRQAEVV